MNEKLLTVLLEMASRNLWQALEHTRTEYLAVHPLEPDRIHLASVRCDYYQPLRGTFGDGCTNPDHWSEATVITVPILEPIYAALNSFDQMINDLKTSA